MRRAFVGLVAALLLLASSAPALAQGKPVAQEWKVYTYAPSDQTLKSHPADSAGFGGFTFTTTPDVALFATERPEGPQASLLNRTLRATFQISDAAIFSYSGQGEAWNSCGTPATARFYFNTNGAFGFGTDNDWYSKYWWSDPATSSAVLGNGSFTMTAKVSAESWSNWNGQGGLARPDGFAAAAADPDLVGFSFGGGCFFENGVGNSSGNATFTLTHFDISD